MSNDFTVAGFDAAGVTAGIKKNGNLDLALIASRTPCRAAGVFTQNAFAAAPVYYDKRLIEFNPSGIYGVVVNSGNANACTSVEGDANTKRTAEAVEQLIGASDNSVLVMSTGVIGVQLPMDKLLGGVPKVVDALRPEGWEDAAKAIMTTDTVHKVRTRSVTIGGQTVRMTGIVKGAGMIHPNMATMLSVVATDAHIAQPLLQQALSTAADLSYNRISIDGDTSTNDTVLLLANGMAGHAEIVDAGSAEFGAFQAALNDLCTELAQALVRDGEGATKFIQIQVNGGVSKADAHLAANTLAISPLCKTAFYGSDANWGRFVMALGRSGANVKPDQCSIYITGGIDNSQRLPELQLLAGGMPTGYAEADAAERFAQKEIDVRIELGLGDGSATVWTSDLSHEYVSINADYRT
ncbi:MAG: bifunctional glutamate N-acetyltransferase/amino-acid acetyltransferase ArgJ [Caldilineaceae bacterium]|nr:bifunctional glutamate N-acetyltransferase/amino-acid acetyltransferase ArgJ [Caldilineaceae bacterium]